MYLLFPKLVALTSPRTVPSPAEKGGGLYIGLASYHVKKRHATETEATANNYRNDPGKSV